MAARALSASARREVYGPFEVIERLGIGGMATVHRAMERGIEGFQRVVALKRLLPHLAEDEAFVRAFVREAKLASLLQHGNIVQLYELGRVGSSYFISMEYIRGRDVRRILRQAKRVTGPLPVPVAVALIAELLDALDYAHTRTDEDGTPLGLVHRDISPSNLILSHTGHLKIIDFGIAKATLGHLATHTGRIKGKLSYMAPEALTGKGLDGRSDLFSASIIAHELLTAHPLFAAKNDFHTIERVQLMEAPPPSVRNPNVPPALDALVHRGLSKDPAHRWRTAGEMRAALAEITLRHRLHCTNREVADWVEIAFALGNSAEMAASIAPVAAASRRPMPLSADRVTPIPGMVPMPPGGGDDDDDEILDLVWDAVGPGEAIPIIVDGVPDVSERFNKVSLDDDDETEMRGPPRQPRASTGPLHGGRLPIDPSFGPDEERYHGEPRVTFRRAATPLPAASGEMGFAADETAVPQEVASSTTQPIRRQRPARKVTTPGEWAAGTSPTTDRPSREELLGPPPLAQLRARPVQVDIGSGIVDRIRPSRVSWLVAAIAVVAVVGVVVWAMTRGESQPARRAAAPEPAKSEATVAPAPVATALDVGSPTAAPPAAVPEAEPSSSEKRSRRRSSRSDDEPEPEPPPEPVAEKPPVEPEPAPTVVPPRPPSLLEGELRPLPVQVKEPPKARPSKKPAAPKLIAPNLARRRSGVMPVLRGTRSAGDLRAISAKLCLDRKGTVTSVSVLSKVDGQVKEALVRALSSWRYDPVREGGAAVPVCFATTFKVSQR
jgi:hypothetical protein